MFYWTLLSTQDIFVLVWQRLHLFFFRSRHLLFFMLIVILYLLLFFDVYNFIE